MDLLSFFARILLNGTIIFVVLLYLGYGITRWLLPDQYRRGGLLIMPLIGGCFILSLGFYFSWLGLGVRDYLWVIFGLATILNLALYRRDKEIVLPLKANILPLIAALVLFLICLSPLHSQGGLSTIGINQDAVFSCNVSTYLQRGGIPAPEPSFEYPASIQVGSINFGVWIGFILLQTFTNELLRLDAYQTFSLLTALFLALHLLTFYFLSYWVLGLKRGIAQIALLFLPFNPLLVWLHYDNFAANTLCLALLPLTIGTIILAFEHKGLKIILLAALSLSGVIATYPWVLSFTLGPALLYILYLWRVQKEPLFPLIFILGRIGAYSIAFNLISYVNSITLLSFVLTKSWFDPLTGNVVAYIPFTGLFGLTHHKIPTLELVQKALPLLSWVIVSLLGYGIIKLPKQERYMFLAILIPYAASLILLRTVFSYPYGYFKTISLATPIWILALATGIYALWEIKIRLLFKGVAIVCISSLLFINIYTIIDLTRFVQSHLILDLSKYKDLRPLTATVNPDEGIYIRDEGITGGAWISYFLRDRKLSLNPKAIYYAYEYYPLAKPANFYHEVPFDNYILINKGTDNNPEIYLWIREVIAKNSHYQLIKKGPGQIYYLDFLNKPLRIEGQQTLKIIIHKQNISVGNKSFPWELMASADKKLLFLCLFTPPKQSLDAQGIGLEKRSLEDKSVITKDLTGIKPPFVIKLGNNSPTTVILPAFISLVDPLMKDLVIDIEKNLSSLIWLDFGIPGARRYLSRGWSIYDEVWEKTFTYVWSDTTESVFNLPVKVIKDYTMSLRLLPVSKPGQLPQSIKIFINGKYLRELSLIVDSWKNYQVYIPSTLLYEGVNTFRFVYRYTYIPPQTESVRNLGVAVDYICLK